MMSRKRLLSISVTVCVAILIFIYLIVLYFVTENASRLFSSKFRQIKEGLYQKYQVNIEYEDKEIKKHLFGVDIIIKSLSVESINNDTTTTLVAPSVMIRYNVIRPSGPTIIFSKELNVRQNDKEYQIISDETNEVRTRFDEKELKKFKYRQRGMDVFSNSSDLVAKIDNIKILFDVRYGRSTKSENYIVSLQSNDLSKFDFSGEFSAFHNISLIDLNSDITITKEKDKDDKFEQMKSIEINDLKLVTNKFELYSKGSIDTAPVSRFIDVGVGVKNYRNFIDIVYNNGKIRLQKNNDTMLSNALDDSYKNIYDLVDNIKKNGTVQDNHFNNVVNANSTDDLVVNVSYHQQRDKEIQINGINFSQLVNSLTIKNGKS